MACRLVKRTVFSDMCKDVSAGVSAGVSVDMCADMCAHMLSTYMCERMPLIESLRHEPGRCK